MHFIPSPYKVVTEYENAFIKNWNNAMAAAFVDVLKYMSKATKQAIVTKAEDDELEKARSGYYKDNSQNVKLDRVGQRYGTAKIETPKVVYEKQKSTDKVYYNNSNEKWNEKRVKDVHTPILNDYLKKGQNVQNPTVYLMMGAFGAGKGYIKKHLQDNGLIPTDFVDVDTDVIRMDKKYLGKDFEGYAAVNKKSAGKMTQRESSHLSDLIVQNLRSMKSNLIVDKSFADYETLMKTIDNFQKAGYKVNVIMAYQTLKNGLRNIEDREKRTKRGILEKDAKAVYKKIENTTKKFIENLPRGVSFSQYQVIDTEHPPIHHFSKSDDKVEGIAKIEV